MSRLLFYRAFALTYLWLSLSIAAPSQASQLRRTAPTWAGRVPPSRDPWYTAPPGYENTKPGTVLRVRVAPGNLTEAIGSTSASYHILFRTTDSRYKPTWAVTTLLVPQLGSNSTAQATFNRSALLTYLVPYDSSSVDASPSYSLYNNQYAPQLRAALAMGMFISVPDYEGPLAAFTAGVISGHATLDSIRAVLSLGLGLDTTSPRVALWGYSGGALAGEWAAELQVQYAPELSEVTVGAALGGLTPNITSAMEAASGNRLAGLVPSSLLGITSQYPAAWEYLLSQLKTSGPYNKTGFLAAQNLDVASAGARYANEDIGGYFENGLATLAAPVMRAMFNRDGVMGYHGLPRMPLFSYMTIQDELSKIVETDALMEKYCQMGANILYQRNSIGTHLEEAVNSASAAMQWLAVVLSGSHAAHYPTSGCTFQNVTRNGTSPEI